MGYGLPRARKLIGLRKNAEDALRGQDERQPERREQRLHVEERVDARDAVARELEDDERPRLVPAARRRAELAERRRAARRRAKQARALALRARPEQPPLDR